MTWLRCCGTSLSSPRSSRLRCTVLPSATAMSQVQWLPEPVPIDETMRSKLDAFQGRPPAANWAWFVQSTSRLSEHDFRLLTAASMQASA